MATGYPLGAGLSIPAGLGGVGGGVVSIAGVQEAWLDGFALAATIAEDSGAVRALGGVSDALAPAVRARMTALAGLDAAARRTEMERLAVGLQPRVRPGVELPPRARALVAADVDRGTARTWLAASPPPRRRWAASRALRAVLRRLGSRPSATDPDAAGRELGAGRAHLARIEPPVEVTLGAELGPHETAAIVAMRALGGAAAPSSRDERLVAVARAITPPGELVRTVGALALGASGAGGGDAQSARLRDTGRELAELEGGSEWRA